MRKLWFAASILGILAPLAQAQSAMPTWNALLRVRMIESQYGKGTAFSIDVDQREYWITAKHMLNGAKHPPYGSVTVQSVSLKILDPASNGTDENPVENWETETFTVLDTEKDIDIVVLAPSHVLLNTPLPSEPAESAGAMFGGECEFLGFPYGGWRTQIPGSPGTVWMPFVSVESAGSTACQSELEKCTVPV